MSVGKILRIWIACIAIVGTTPWLSSCVPASQAEDHGYGGTGGGGGHGGGVGGGSGR